MSESGSSEPTNESLSQRPPHHILLDKTPSPPHPTSPHLSPSYSYPSQGNRNPTTMLLRRLPTSAVRSTTGQRTLISLSSSTRAKNPITQSSTTTSTPTATTQDASAGVSSKMFEFDAKRVAGEIRKRGLTSATTRDAGMDRVSFRDFSTVLLRLVFFVAPFSSLSISLSVRLLFGDDLLGRYIGFLSRCPSLFIYISSLFFSPSF